MTTQNPGAGGLNPQAQGLREIEEDADALRTLLQCLVDHAVDNNGQLGDSLVEYHRRALELEAEIDRLGGDNRHLVDQYNVLRERFLEKLRLIPDLQRMVRITSWEGQRLSHDKALLQDEVQRLAAFVRLLQAELPKDKGGGNLRNGDCTMQTSREWLFLLLVVVAIALGIILGGFADQYNWSIGVLSTLSVFLAISAVITSRIEWGALQLRLPFANMLWPLVALDTQQWYQELLAKPGVIKTRPIDGLDAREAELVAARADLAVERAELATQIRDLRDTEVGELVDARDQLRTKWQEHEALSSAVPPVQADIDAAWNEYNQAIDSLCDAAHEIVNPSQELITTLDRINILTNTIESSPAGLAATVARLKDEYAAAEAEVKRAREDANSFYTYPRWYVMLFLALTTIVMTTWNYANINKIIGQSLIAEGKDPGNWISGGETMARPGKRELYLKGCEELPLGKNGPVTAVQMPDGRIVVYLGAGDLDTETRSKIRLSEQSAPPPNGK